MFKEIRNNIGRKYMESICILDDFKVNRNEKFIKVSTELEPKIKRKKIFPVNNVEYIMKKEDTLVLDFENHYVGYVNLNLSFQGSHPDAPAYIYLKFAERLEELQVDSEKYTGWLGKGWIQEEYIHVDTLPCMVILPRRYAFRYVQIKVIDVSLKYALVVQSVVAETVTSAYEENVFELNSQDELLNQIDLVGIRTLRNCMQLVFEDGPKRDRRMWLGDLRLQAKVNYLTFRNNDLVKRCLYLFAGLTFNEGKIPACIFVEPIIEPDDTYLIDYALLFNSVLLDYYEETHDMDTLNDLYQIAIRQIEIVLSYLDDDGILPDKSDEFWCFIDWGDGLNTQAASMAVLLYAINCAICLAKYEKDIQKIDWLENWQKCLKERIMEHFWDEEQRLFISGKNRQVSWATQIWMILAKVLSEEGNRKLIWRTEEMNPSVRIVTPYMKHHYIEALIECGETKHALKEIKGYWGGMIKEGADTFWEVYNPDHLSESPYGSISVNSFCHAWSCTPVYFLRKFLNIY